MTRLCYILKEIDRFMLILVQFGGIYTDFVKKCLQTVFLEIEFINMT